MQVVYRSIQMMFLRCAARREVKRDRRSASPLAIRSRIIVDETSRVCACTRKMRVESSMLRRRAAAGQVRARSSGSRAVASSIVMPGRAMTTKCARSRKRGYPCHAAIPANASVPRMKKSCDARQPAACSARRVSSVYERSLSHQLHVRHAPVGTIFNSQRGQREAVVGAAHAVRWGAAADRARESARSHRAPTRSLAASAASR